MIYTLTINPALDYIIEIQNFKLSNINRSEKEYIFPGGKGINVSIVLKELGIDSTALGFIGGFTGTEIENKVQKYGVKTDFVNVNVNEGISRINVKIETESEETAINGKGPYISSGYIDLLYEKIRQIKKGDILVLSGSVAEGVEEDIYQKICHELQKNEVKIIVDARGNLLLKTLEYKPFLIKPNQEELEEIFNTKITNKEQVIQLAKELQIKGAKNVLVSMGSEGAIFLSENGEVFKRKACVVKERINTVGAGDSMIAGFIAGYKLSSKYEEALDMGIAAATATTASMFLGKKEKIYNIYNDIKDTK
jgi:1-phosphofructokinase